MVYAWNKGIIYCFELCIVFGWGMPKSYRHVSLPEDLVRRIERIIKKEKYGYQSIAEFVKDAIRRRLEEIEKEDLL